jgi:hypothetical protein
LHLSKPLLVAVFSIYGCMSHSADAIAESDLRYYTCSQNMWIPLDHPRPLHLRQYQDEGLPRALYGLCLDSNGAVYLADSVSERLLKYSRRGDVLYEVASRGEGPEDLKDRGEPFKSAGADVFIHSLTPRPKLLAFNEEGSLVSSLILNTSDSLARIWPVESGDLLVLHNHFAYSPSRGTSGSILLSLFGTGGDLIKSVCLSTFKLPARDKLESISTRDLEVWPSIGVLSDGTMLVQSNTYEPNFQCYSGSLAPVWSYRLEEAEERAKTAREIEVDSEGQYIQIYPKAPPVGQIVAQGDEFWIEVPLANPLGNQVSYLALSRSGEELGPVLVRDLREKAGQYIIQGSRIAYEAERASGDRGLVIGDLVPDSADRD